MRDSILSILHPTLDERNLPLRELGKSILSNRFMVKSNAVSLIIADDKTLKQVGVAVCPLYMRNLRMINEHQILANI